VQCALRGTPQLVDQSKDCHLVRVSSARALFGVFDAFEDEQVPAALFPRQLKPGCCLSVSFRRRPSPAEATTSARLPAISASCRPVPGALVPGAAWTADPGTGPGLHGCDAPAEARP
jgi:hypothetical protein